MQIIRLYVKMSNHIKLLNVQNQFRQTSPSCILSSAVQHYIGSYHLDYGTVSKIMDFSVLLSTILATSARILSLSLSSPFCSHRITV